MALDESVSPAPRSITLEVATSVYGQDVIDAMHELAQLIFACRAFTEAAAEFRNGEDFDLPRAKAVAAKMKKPLASLSDELLATIRGTGHNQMRKRLNLLRRANAPLLAEVARHASELVCLRRKAYGPEAAGSFERDHLTQRLQLPLEQLAARWAAL